MQRRTYRHTRKHGKKIRAQTKIQKKKRAQTKHVTMAHHMQLSRPHPKKSHLLPRCDSVMFTQGGGGLLLLLSASSSFEEGRLSTRSLPTKTPFPRRGGLLLAFFLLTTQSVTLALVAVPGA